MLRKTIAAIGIMVSIASITTINASADVIDNTSSINNVSQITNENLAKKDSNIELGGMLATDGISTFYVKDVDSDFTQSIYRCNNDGTGDVEILGNEKNIQYDCLNICGDWIYYRKIDRNSKDSNKGESLCKIKKDGTEKTELISDLQFRNMQIRGNYIYLEIYSSNEIRFGKKGFYKIYSSNETRFGKKGFYKFNLDGTLSKAIIQDNNSENCYNFDVIGDYAYFLRSYDDGRLGRTSLDRINLDGTNKVQVIDNRNLVNLSFGKIMNDGEYIYYTKSYMDTDENGSNGIYRIKKDGTDEKKIYDGSVYDVNLSDGWIYCYSPDKNKILRMKNDGTEVSEIGFQNVFNTGNYIAGDWIYYNVVCGKDSKGKRDVRLIRTKIDGSKTQVLN